MLCNTYKGVCYNYYIHWYDQLARFTVSRQGVGEFTTHIHFIYVYC